jgi:hypothetical protein
MGSRAETWPAQRLDAMAVFFSQVGYKSTSEWKEEIIFHNPPKTSAGPLNATLPDGRPVTLKPGNDPRKVFADWLLAPDNPHFARSIANRAWFWLLGRGIVHEPDDFRDDNPASNPALLDYLQTELISSGYDMKHLFRVILNSQTYQLSSIPRSDHPDAATNFAYYPLRRVEAEVLIDALCRLSGTTESYSSPIPEPFTFIPPEHRSISLSDGSITSTFLEMFGRPARDTGQELERNNAITAAQRLHLLNSSHIQQKLQRSRPLQQLYQPRRPQQSIVQIYLTILSRYPTPDETRTALAYVQAAGVSPRDASFDLIWALVNSAEFLHRH